jgi:thiamine-phosphate diphosphorylase
VIRCYITDRHTIRGRDLLDTVAWNLAAGVDWIQIRMKERPARELYDLTRAALAQPNPHGSKIIVNSNLDIALATGAAGLHLPAGSPPPRQWRSLTPPGFLIGMSCHSVAEVQAAESEGADYVVFGPVFTPKSHYTPQPPRGVEELARAVGAVKIPVLALGGITHENTAACISAGAAGIAGVSMFQSC